MEQMQFGGKWRNWIHGCLMSAKASVLINGTPTKEFPMTKGVRQGDPLSPFLFILAMEGLNIAMKTACSKGIFEGLVFPNTNFVVSHLFYVDDALFISKWSRRNIDNLARVLKCFHASSGLKVNFHKSRVFGIGVPSTEVSAWASPFGCEPALLPFSYLGIPVGENMNFIKAWKPVIDRFKAKLSVWKSKSLSFGGRVTLAKAVLGSLPTYYMSLFKAPIGVIDELEKIRRNLLWNGSKDSRGINWISWEKIMSPKEVGGLGLGSIKSLNISLLSKWWWRLRVDHNALWAKTIMAIHRVENLRGSMIASASGTGTWKNIARIAKVLKEVGIQPSQVIRWNMESSSWKSDFVDMGGFSVSLLRARIDRSSHPVCDGPVIWHKVVPLKINCFVWRAKLNRIPTLMALSKRGVNLGNTSCGACIFGEEDADQVLVSCFLANRVLNDILCWCNVRMENLLKLKDIIDFINCWGNCNKKRIGLVSIIYGMFWCLWRARNDRIFNGTAPNPVKIVNDTKAMVYVWHKHRTMKGDICWNEWCNSPLDCL